MQHFSCQLGHVLQGASGSLAIGIVMCSDPVLSSSLVILQLGQLCVLDLALDDLQPDHSAAGADTALTGRQLA